MTSIISPRTLMSHIGSSLWGQGQANNQKLSKITEVAPP